MTLCKSVFKMSFSSRQLTGFPNVSDITQQIHLKSTVLLLSRLEIMFRNWWLPSFKNGNAGIRGELKVPFWRKPVRQQANSCSNSFLLGTYLSRTVPKKCQAHLLSRCQTRRAKLCECWWLPWKLPTEEHTCAFLSLFSQSVSKRRTWQNLRIWSKK